MAESEKVWIKGEGDEFGLVLRMDGENLIFSDEAFAALLDFPYLSSLTMSSSLPSLALNMIKTSCSSSSLSSSSSCSLVAR